MPCSKWRPFPCQNLCGNPLLCGNHYCTKSCHVLEVPLKQIEGDPIASVNKENALAEPCEQCDLPCQRVCYSLSHIQQVHNFGLVCLTKLNMKKLLHFCMALSLVQDIDSNVCFRLGSLLVHIVALCHAIWVIVHLAKSLLKNHAIVVLWYMLSSVCILTT